MDSIPQWFPGTRLNFAENILFTPDPADRSIATKMYKRDNSVACTQVREGCSSITHMSWGGLRRRVGLLSNAMRALGVKKGVRIAVVASHSFDTLIVFLATTALGGLFSSSSTDMGTKGILDRLTQIKPRYLFFDDWAVYNGQTVDLREKMKEVVHGMKNVKEFQSLVSVNRFTEAADVNAIPLAITLASFVAEANGNEEVIFERIQFSDPFLVVYSSGTTGTPKCIVHSVGGAMMSAKKEGILHGDNGPGRVTLQYTTVRKQSLSIPKLPLPSGHFAGPMVKEPFTDCDMLGDR